jgi:hypothetical protein
MLSIGQELYTETDRDRVTTQLESYFRSGTFTWSIGTAQADLFFNTPPDRLLWLHAMTMDAFAGATASRITSVNVQLIAPDTGTGRISDLLTRRASGGIAEGGEAPSNSCAFNTHHGILLPRGCSMRLLAQRSDTTVAGTFVWSAQGYLVPPGNVARGA